MRCDWIRRILIEFLLNSVKCSGKHSHRILFPNSCSFEEKVVLSKTSYNWNTEEMWMIALCGSGMACLSFLMEIKNGAQVNTCHGKANSKDRLAMLHLWKRVCRVKNKSSPTRPCKWFLTLSRLGSEDWTTPAQLWQQHSIFGLIWLFKRKPSRRIWFYLFPLYYGPVLHRTHTLSLSQKVHSHDFRMQCSG